MVDKVDLLIYNTSQVLTLEGPPRPRIGDEMDVLHPIKNGAVAVKADRILDVGTTDHILEIKFNQCLIQSTHTYVAMSANYIG